MQNILSRFIAVIVLLCLVLVVCAAGGGWFYATRALPVLDGLASLPELGHSANVVYDETGVPYIDAASDRDAYMVQGYVTACDRMFQMDILRRTAQGELSEVFGTDFLSHDKLLRTLGFKHVAEAELKLLPSDVRAYLDGYTRGVNQYIASAENRLPLEFVILGYQPRKWKSTDTLALLRYLQYEEDESWQLDDLRQRILDKAGDKVASYLFEQPLKPAQSSYLPSASQDKLIADCVEQLPARGVLPNPSPLWGSNAWAIGPGLTKVKSAILACDMHSAFTSPDRYYFCSLTSPMVHASGGTIPGVPGIVSGRNAYYAWGSTALHADAQDLVLEQLSPQFPGKYRTASGWENVTETHEDINVRFSNAYVHKVNVTKHGPILLQNENTAVALSWLGVDPKNQTLPTILKLNQGRNWADFTAALQIFGGAARTFVYADKDGNVGMHSAGAIPVRTASGAMVVPGWNGSAEWHGRMAFDSLPHAYNPPQGFVVADNPQFGAISSTNNPVRAIHIGDTLSAMKKAGQPVGLPDMGELQGDVMAPFAAVVKKQLEQSITSSQLIDEMQTAGMEAMKRWDGSVRSDSNGATVYESFLQTITRRALEPKLGTGLTREYLARWPRWSLFTQKVVTSSPKDWLPPEERTYETFLITTFAQALKNIKLATNSVEVGKATWGHVHKVRFQPVMQSHGLLSGMLAPLFDRGAVGVSGDQDCVNACNIVASDTPWNFSCDSGPTERLLIDMSDDQKFYESLPLGQSGNLFSPYRSDQVRNWLRMEPHGMAFSAAQLDRQAQHKLVLNQ